MSYRKKLIEVALPLDAINAASAREKSIRHGHPSTLHLWWARRPLAACRAVLFSSMVDDPAEADVPTGYLELLDQLEREWRTDRHHHGEGDAERRRAFLFDFLGELVTWESSSNEELLEKANRLIVECAPERKPPPVLDPFCGGGSIPLEAQRLGLEARGSDINPVAVLISKAMIEIPPQWRDRSPVHPDAVGLGTGVWKGAQGLAEDVRRYGAWMREEAKQKIGHLYPPVEVTAEMAADRPDLKPYVGRKLTVVAWLWARTVPSPNPVARGAAVPLVRSFALSTKKGKETWIEPVVDSVTMTYEFTVKTRQNTPDGRPPEKTVSRTGARCVLTGSAIPLADVRAHGKAGRMSTRLMAIVAEGDGGRVYLPPVEEHAVIAEEACATWRPDIETSDHSQYMGAYNYGLTTWASLFTERQLAALSTFADLVPTARDRVHEDACEFGMSCEDSAQYADAVATYLGLGVGRLSDILNNLCAWEVTKTQVRHLFTRQAISMKWDFGENNAFSGSAGDFKVSLGSLANSLAATPNGTKGRVILLPVQDDVKSNPGALISSDPPYYDNVPYSDLSDFFYVWLRRALRKSHPSLFEAEVTPKAKELVADRVRLGGALEARRFFEGGMRKFFGAVAGVTPDGYPATLIYAFKQQDQQEELDEDEPSLLKEVEASTGWETFLQGLVEEGMAVTATWPLRTELANRMRGQNSNALAGSIVLAVRPRAKDAPNTDRRGLIRALREELPDALRELTKGGLPAPDLAQAAIGPGMAVYSRYAKITEADERPLRVREALKIINQVKDEVLEEGEGDLDPATRFAITWYAHVGFGTDAYGEAEKIAIGRDIPVQRVAESGVIESRAGKVRLKRIEELDPAYDPSLDELPTLWEAVHHLAKRLSEGGVSSAGRLLRRYRDAQPKVDVDLARDLAYRLYEIANAKRRTSDQLPYNALSSEWSAIEDASREDAAGWETASGQAAMNL